MPTSLLAFVPTRRSRTFPMLLGSVAFHALLVAVASFWPTHPALSKYYPPTQWYACPPEDGPSVNDLPSSTPTVDEPAPTPPPVLPDDPLVDDAPPPAVEPDLFVPPAPTPVPAARHPSAPSASVRPAHVASPSARARPGAPGSSASPGSGRAAGPVGGYLGPGGGDWRTSKPPYPYAMRAARVQGSGSVRVTTDSFGRVLTATVVQSTGSAVLDSTTCSYARGFWSGPPNATTTVPITYRLP